MTNQRVLDDNENDKSTKDGAADQGSHHDDMLGHILEDISLDEWDVVPDLPQSVAPPDIVAREIAAPDAPEPSASAAPEPGASAAPEPSASAAPEPGASASDIKDIELPDDEWAPSEIVPLPEIGSSEKNVPLPEMESAPKPQAAHAASDSPPENAPSLFAFSMMQKFGALDTEAAEEPISADLKETTMEEISDETDAPAYKESIKETEPTHPTELAHEPIHTTSEPIEAKLAPVESALDRLKAKLGQVKPTVDPLKLASDPVDRPTDHIDPLLVPAPPVAIGPNPFAIKIAPIVEPQIVEAAPTPAPVAPDTPAPTASPPTPDAATSATPAPAAPAPPAPIVSTPAAPAPALTAPTSAPAAIAPAPAPAPAPSAAPASAAPASAAHGPGSANTRIPALAPTPAMLLAQANAAPIPSPFPAAPTPAVIPPAVASTSATPAPNGASTPAQPKRKPAATLIFDSFTKSKIEAAGIDLLDPFNLNAKLAANPPTQPKQRNTARTLIFKAGNPVDEMESLLSPSPNPATTTGSNPTVSANPSVGPNLAAAIAAYQAAGGGPAPAAAPVSTDAAARANSNVIPAHPAGGARPIARTMILKSLAKPEPNEVTEPLAAPQDGRPSAETIIAAGHAAEAAEAAEAQAAEAGRPKIAKRSTAPTLIFKAFTLPNPAENAKPAPLKIIRYDSSKLRNLETNVKPLTIAESIAAAKQASMTDDNKNGPQWLKLVTANPLLKSQKFRSAALLIVLTSALLVCATALMKSLYSDGQDFHPTNITAAARDQHHYKSTDGGKSLDILDKDKGSVLVHNGKAIHGKIKPVSDGDLITLATTPPSKREIWLQKTDAGYVDSDGTILYSASAPELIIAKKIDSYANILAAKYKETKLYPSDAERFERMSPKDFRYTNPFTGHVDQPNIQYKRFAAADASWTDHTQAGHAWPEEPPFKPGAIHCICLDYCRFFVRGFDRNGQPLYGSVPGVADYVELKDGANMNPRRNDKVTDDKDKTPAVFMVSRSPILQMEVALLRQASWLVPVAILVVVLLSGGWMLFLRRMKNNKADSTANTTKFITK